TRRTGRTPHKSEAELRRTNRHSVRRGTRLGGCDYSTARDARCSDSFAAIRHANHATGAFPHWRNPGVDETIVGRLCQTPPAKWRFTETPYNSAKICVICGYLMPTVLIEKQTPQITLLTLKRPERRNALPIELLSDLNAAIKIASDQPQERVIILRGAGAAFCTGLDLKEAADQTKAHATAEMVANTLITISQTRLITIAIVHGAAVAGGAGIMSACDFVVAAQRTKI